MGIIMFYLKCILEKTSKYGHKNVLKSMSELRWQNGKLAFNFKIAHPSDLFSVGRWR